MPPPVLLGAYLEVFEEFGERMTAPLSDAQRARAEEIDAKEERGDATPEEVHFLKQLRFKNGRRPNSLYYYRELQNLRDPLHFRQK